MLDTTAPAAPLLAAGSISVADTLGIALRHKALSDPVRVQLMALIMAHAETGICSCDLAPFVGVREATESHHLEQLRDACLVEDTRKGTNT